MPVVWNDDKVWFDESLKLAQICHDVAALQTSHRSVLLLSHFEATLSQLAASLNAKGVRHELFASLNPTDLCRQSPARVWLGSARAFRVTQELTPGSAVASLEVLVAEHHPLQSEDQEVADAASETVLQCPALFLLLAR